MAKAKIVSAMKMHMRRLVLIEKRPFCFRDFLDFEVNGKRYKMKHGTIRNKISELKKNGVIQLEYYSSPAFYSLRGISFSKPKREMTHNHTVVSQLSSLSSVSFIDNLPSERHSVHDIRLRFKTEGIWSTIRSTHPELIPNEVSKDISLSSIQMYNMEAKTDSKRINRRRLKIKE